MGRIFETAVGDMYSIDNIDGMNSWKKASKVLIAVGAQMLINHRRRRDSKRMKSMDDRKLGRIFSIITDSKIFGDIAYILANLKKIFQSEIRNIQARCWSLQAECRKSTKAKLNYLLLTQA